MKKEKFKFQFNSSILVSSIVTFLVCACLFSAIYIFILKDITIETTRVEKDVTVTDTGIADAVEKVYDSVVVVETYLNDSLYATGTGFVLKVDDQYGYIITNYHVIESGTSVSVIFSNEEKVETTVVGGDEYADIAVLTVPKDKILKTIEIGNSSDLRVGDTTFTVGAPLDAQTYSWSVTRGILSGKNRLIEVSSGRNNIVMDVLQTDAAINSGNSGGPLCNSNGEVIGVINMKIASNTIEGMGFAIPIETAVEYASKFINGENVSRPYIGVSLYDKTNFFGVSSGLFIDSVEKDSPADKSGLKSGDKIVKVNGEKVDSYSYFKYELYKYEVGEEITITYERDGKEKDIKITLGSTSKTT